MGIRLPCLISNVRQFHRLNSSLSRGGGGGHSDVPKGHFAVYVGENQKERKRFVLPICYLNHPTFQDLLRRAEEEFGYDHPMGGLTIPCDETAFLKLTSRLQQQFL